MNYHNITTEDMLNGSGLRTVLWLSGCSHHCKGCQNPITWNPKDGIPFDEEAKKELYSKLNHDYIAGITLSGGDPLHENNRVEVKKLIEDIRRDFINKDVWIYTGYTIEEIMAESSLKEVVDLCNVIVEGKFIEELKDLTYHWAGSSNQRVLENINGTWTNYLVNECNRQYEKGRKDGIDETAEHVDNILWEHGVKTFNDLHESIKDKAKELKEQKE